MQDLFFTCQNTQHVLEVKQIRDTAPTQVSCNDEVTKQRHCGTVINTAQTNIFKSLHMRFDFACQNPKHCNKAEKYFGLIHYLNLLNIAWFISNHGNTSQSSNTALR